MTMPPQSSPSAPVTIAKRDGQAGVIPMSAVTEKPGVQGRSLVNSTAARQSTQRLKVVIRRLPPGLTEQEFYVALGDEWKTGNGKVTWANYRPGKVSKDLAKSSRPARCLLQVADPNQLNTLSQIVPKTPFADSKGTQHDPSLVGPPMLEYATYTRVPNSKRRNDARQGTIDQDPEFMDFLQSLTAPIQKPKALDANDMVKEEPVTVTPLIQHLRDKKAAKEKNAAAKAAKQEKQQDDSKPENKRPSSTKDAVAAAKDVKPASPAKTPANPAKDVRSPPRNEQRAAASPRAQQAAVAKTAAPPPTTAPSERRRDTTSPAAGAARMFQRDLPFQPQLGRGGRAASRGRGGKSPEVRKATLNTSSASTPGPNGITPPATTQAAPPATSTAATTAQKAPASTPQASSPLSTAVTAPSQPKVPAAPAARTPRQLPKPSPSDPTATRAFLKHANASQGITEAPLGVAMRQYGPVTSLSIDKRKGFAYVDFEQPTGLQAAMAASPVPIAQGSVQVLERKDRVDQGHAHPQTAGGRQLPIGHVPPMNPNPRGAGRGGVGFRPVRGARPGGRGGKNPPGSRAESTTGGAGAGAVEQPQAQQTSNVTTNAAT